MHLIKLCVGTPTVEDLVQWRAERRAQGHGRADGLNVHRTRMMPKRRDEIIGVGSLYWVMSGKVRCRQRIVGLEPATNAEGISFCDILLDPAVIKTAPLPKRPFQGWRYLKPGDAPADLEGGPADDSAMVEDLARLGLI
jgi:hypothetical protein